MKIHHLHLQDFRSYEDQAFTFDSDKVFIFGANGIGKTNILEAISLLSVGKSWRETSSRDLISEQLSVSSEQSPNGGSAKISARVGESDWSLLIQDRSRAFERDGKRIPAKEAMGQVSTLLFCPEYLRLFTGAKKDRLAYLDRFLCQIDPGAREHLFRSVRAHKQKTALLRELSEDPSRDPVSELQAWNQILAESVPLLWQKRQEVLRDLEPGLRRAYHQMSGKKESVRLELILSLPPNTCRLTPHEVGAWLESQVSLEVASRRNSLSPLRDDVGFFLRDRLVCESGSRGEERSMLLSLLSAQKERLVSKYDTTPILLLDDVFSELDDDRQTHLEALCEGVQTFFTTTHAEHVAGFSGEVQKIRL